MGVPRNTEVRSPRPFSLDTNCKVGGPITAFRFSDSLGLTERGRAIVLMVIAYHRKKVQLKIKGKGKWKECKRDQV